MKPIITVDGVSKRYTIGKKESYGSLRDEVMDALSSPFRRLFGGGAAPDPSVWALKDVSFEVFEGDVLGIIGRNGAGKSTLLKILSRITEPTEGRIEMRGRIASLLEVGTGFHPELTGRENIFMNGALLGMSSREIKSKFDEIVAFSEIEKFLDTPVKRYSSGMYVRLAFAVAAHLEPEILIIDEVLAVGDAAFQKKCLGKMGEVARGGRTVLFVSHNMTAVKSLCNKCILMEQGSVKEHGESSRVIDNYFSKSAGVSNSWKNSGVVPGNEKIRLQYAEVKVEGKEAAQNITVNDPISLHFQLMNFEAGSLLNFSLHLYNTEDVKIFNSVSKPLVYPAGEFCGTCHVPANLLNDGIYRVKIMITKDMSTPVFWLDDVLVFEVHDSERQGNWFGKWSGVVRPELKWDTQV
jgi:lipopolysaccharide transport system ATP-binding protein